jgi:hypothetical protein
MRRTLAAVALSLPVLAAADEVFLKNGGKLSGQIVSEDGQSVVLDAGPGRVTLAAANVSRIERGQTALSKYRERAGRLAAGDVQGWLELGFWAQERDLATQAQEAFERVQRLDPQNAAANAALGRVQMNGRYMSLEDSYRERGYVHHDGEWMTPAEHEARLRAAAAEAQAYASRREGEIRMREAEARAREAEADALRAEAEADAANTQGGIPLWWGWGGSSVILPPFLPHPHRVMPPFRKVRPPLPPSHPRPAPTPAPTRQAPTSSRSTRSH